MAKPINQYQTIQANLAERMAKIQENLAEKMGLVGEEVSKKEQMAAFDAMTPQDWARMIGERGPIETLKFNKEMLRRKSLSQAKVQPA